MNLCMNNESAVLKVLKRERADSKEVLEGIMSCLHMPMDLETGLRKEGRREHFEDYYFDGSIELSISQQEETNNHLNKTDHIRSKLSNTSN